MRPGVKLDRDHLDRFAKYIDELRARILAGTGGPYRRITGQLVADELTKSPGNMQAIERLQASDMNALEWEILLVRAERALEDYFEIMVDRSPDDKRVEDLRGPSSAETAEKAADKTGVLLSETAADSAKIVKRRT
jgi:hypothetical protein